MLLISSGALPEYRQISGLMLVLTFSADSCQLSFSPGVNDRFAVAAGLNTAAILNLYRNFVQPADVQAESMA